MTITTPVLTVSQLNRQVKSYLEHELGTVHVEGEVSNLSKPSSGHFYFTLKDQSAQIKCVFFKNRHTQPLSASLKEGQHLVASGTLSLYEARGDYQLIVDKLTDAGLGQLYQQFEQLKKALAAEGLFNPERKKSIPKIPKTIGVITSPSGAALQDILSTLARRYPLAPVLIYPSEVQGATASQQLIKALQNANTDKRCDVLILARGGGSIEDLWAFNNEQLAREIARSEIPIVSGVGHETDFTIADFVADYRAETPTAAATKVTPDSQELQQFINNIMTRMHQAVTKKTQSQQMLLNNLIHKISSPKQAIASHWQTLDYLERQLYSSVLKNMNQKQHQLNLVLTQLQAKNPINQLQEIKTQVNQLMAQLKQQLSIKISSCRYQLNNYLATLHAVSPLATLDRGYAIATKNEKVLRTTKDMEVGDTIEVRLTKARLTCSVIKIKK